MFSLRTKQVAAITTLVGLTAVALSATFFLIYAHSRLEVLKEQAVVVSRMIYQRAQASLLAGPAPAPGDPLAALGNDPGLESILQGAMYQPNVVYAAIVDERGIVIAHADPSEVGRPLPEAMAFSNLLSQSPVAQFRVIYSSSSARFYDIAEELRIDGQKVGSIRIGVSTLLLYDHLRKTLTSLLIGVIVALVAGTIVAIVIAQNIVRPIHVIHSGLARLGRGELDVAVDLPAGGELSGLGDSFKAVTARLAADRTALAGQRATLESVVGHLEDAVALFSVDGTLLFANPPMRAVFAEGATLDAVLPPGHPYRDAVSRALETAKETGTAPEESRTVTLPDVGDRLVSTYAVEDGERGRVGVMLVARNLAYITQVQSTLNYSQKLAALSRLSAGIAHEVKNPLNAAMIHLELLKMQIGSQEGAAEHLAVLSAQVRRLDEVVQGFLKFTRPETLELRPVQVQHLVAAVMPVIRAEAQTHGVEVREDYEADLPPVNGDSGLLEQAILNLALNACQAMPTGGRLHIAALRAPHGRVEIRVEDTGVGIKPDQLARIFDLYYTTREGGSGIGLSLVYRTVQLHEGEIQVESTPGAGTAFRVLLPRAWEGPAGPVTRA